MGLYGGSTVTYTPPAPDNTQSELLKAQLEYQKSLDDRAEQERAEEKAEEEARKAAAVAGYGGLFKTVKQQVGQGLINYEAGIDKLSDFATEYSLSQPYEDISKITQGYLAALPGKRATGMSAAYEELMGRQATAKELREGQKRFRAGYYTSMEDFKDSLAKSPEYKDKFESSYLENYYKTQFGSQVVNKKGKKTGTYKFKFDPKLLPTYGGNLADRTKITTPDFGDEFVGTPEELQAQQQNIRDTRQYLYSAGLTNLQGEIDKETQSLKNEGSKEVAKIGAAGSLYSNFVSGFWE
jgi:hypothetical protein